MKKKYQITILPINKNLEASEGDNLHTLLIAAGLINQDDPFCNQLRLEKGTVSEAEHPKKELSIFSSSELAEGWLLASERYIIGDAILTLAEAKVKKKNPSIPLTTGYALAIDVGTATITAGLINMDNMRIPLLTTIRNSQADIAVEIEQRIAFCQKGQENIHKMKTILKQDINKAVKKLCYKAGIKSKLINAMVLVGNFSLISIFLGRIYPNPLSCFNTIIKKSSSELGINVINLKANIYILPSASQTFGADTISAILAANLINKINDPKITILIDIGVHSELVVAGQGKLIATAVSTLPLEGAGLNSGMPPQSGAITDIKLENKLILHTVRDARPKGICGAGILSIVHTFLEKGILDSEGRLLEPENLTEDLAQRFRGTIKGREFILSWEDYQFPKNICVNQDDIRQIQLAKGAIFAACQALLSSIEVSLQDIKEILIAESSKANILPKSMLTIGMLPKIALSQIINIGNAAWQGAFLFLSNQDFIAETEKIANTIEELDLTSDQIYAEAFIQAMNFEIKK